MAYVAGFAEVVTAGHGWISGAAGAADVYARAVVFGSALFLGMCLLPIAAKWVLIGRWRPTRIRVWSPAYLRFWLVRTLIRANPLAFLVNGSPLYALYLRALGARVGRGVVVFGHAVPVCTDLLTIGAGTVIRKDSLIAGYRAVDGWIETGPVTIGRDVLIGEATVLDIDTGLGDGAQLGHSSSLHAGQSVPAGEHWHGSPAVRTDVDYRTVPDRRCGRLRRGGYATTQLLTTALVYLPLVLAGIDFLLVVDPAVAGILAPAAIDATGWALVGEALVVSAVVFATLVVGGLLLVAALPRLLALGLRPGQVYPLYGLRYSLHRTIHRLTNGKFFPYLFGDSSYIVGYLRWIGWDASREEQTGSNFGTQMQHESPYLVGVGAGTMVADGLSVMNADVTSTSFRLSPLSIGAHSFLGNRIHYPVGARVGDDCLLATKAMVPIDGPLRTGVGLLGSPPFEIPRTVLRDSRLNPLREPREVHRRLRAKNRYNRHSIALALLVRWGHVFGLTVLALACAHYYGRFGAPAVAVEILLATLFTAVYFVLVERAATGFRPLSPRSCSIYEPYFWWHERYWKLVIPEFDRGFAGTPFKNLVSRALGTRLGRRVFDDGCFLPERTLVTIGDDATLNAGTVVQCHSQEDGGFKSDRTRLGDRVTLAVGAFVHYGVAIGDDAVLAPDSFLMKGEEVPAGDRWSGNPAQPAGPAAGLPAGGPAAPEPRQPAVAR
ncbi:Pls/PosA family non-ribosomal peptide synthetase [Trujillonella humicola]|uniref:Pls/PosA family non-ribosomal peptide synthetase n=1 Tax=Trujillonella humicola TaxID=3383699 RepID=UPI003906536E